MGAGSKRIHQQNAIQPSGNPNYFAQQLNTAWTPIGKLISDVEPPSLQKIHFSTFPNQKMTGTPLHTRYHHH
jgi:hypothetical protein